MVRAMCGVQHTDRNISTDMMTMLGLNETMDPLTMVNSVRWYGHIVRMALDFEGECQRKKSRSNEKIEVK